MKLRNRKGFTLVEVIISLFIASSILITTLMIAELVTKNKISEHLFFQAFDANFNGVQRTCQIKHENAKIIFSNQSGILFYKNQVLVNKIKIPKKLCLASYHQINITTNGYVKPQTINWLDNSKNIAYKQIFQLGWSGYKLVEK